LRALDKIQDVRFVSFEWGKEMASGNSGRGDRPGTVHAAVSPEHD
jgi:hypothetical protein